MSRADSRIERRFKALAEQRRAGLVTFITAGDLGALKSLEHRLGRVVPRIHLPEYDYTGVPQTESRAAARRGRKSRSPTGMGSRSTDDLSPEELEALLNPGS